MKKLSIITPYYNTLKYIEKLASNLIVQLTEEVEWIIVDDGCNEKKLDILPAKVIHLPKNSGNASKPRNIGLDNASGEYITFVDSDDLISLKYVKTIIDKINNSNFDYCYFNWKTSDYEIIIEDEPPEWNKCVWNCIYKRNIIGNTRFKEEYNINEDGLFNEEVRKGKRENIKEILYYYNWSKRDDSITSLFANGKIGNKKE